MIDQDSENFDIVQPYQELYNVSFPSDYLRNEPLAEKEIEQKLKAKYYSNPVYKTLLNLDIDLFLNRQPKNFQLNADQEVDLYTKRRILESYYDSLRYYSQLPYSETFDEFFEGTKSFSNKVYNQQFKGTLRSVRRLFSLTLDSKSDPTGKIQKVLKFDQPLYDFSEKQKFSAYHEELSSQSKQIKEDSKNDFLIKPLYAGWDETLRKFVITNKFLPRSLAGYKVNVDNEARQEFYEDSSNKKLQKIKFTAWPISIQKVSGSKKQSSIPYVILFEPLDETTKESFGESFSTLPANLETFKRLQVEKGQIQETKSGDIFESLAPERGGFIWPGNSKFKLSFPMN